MKHIMQGLMSPVRVAGRAIRWTVAWTVLSIAWGLGLVAGLFGLRRELSPMAMLGVFALLLLGLLVYATGGNRNGGPGDFVVASTTQQSAVVSGRALNPLFKDTQSGGTHLSGRAASRLKLRQRHENQHFRQELDVAPSAANDLEAANARDKAKSAPEKPQLVESQGCKEPDAFGSGRTLTLATRGGGEYGLVTFRNTLALKPGEVVFTFDDGPHPLRTPQVLDILDRHCVKAVFFMIGSMAERNPELVREIKRRGHIIGSHTWSHPLNLAFLSEQRAEDEIERGFAAVNQAAGEPIAPFFRFPGLGHSKRLLEYTARRDYAVWSVDVVSGDSEGVSAGRMPALLRSRLQKHGRGILLFHDIKKTTVEALPVIIEMLRRDGYHAVHVVPDTPFVADPAIIAKLDAHKRQSAELRYRWRLR